MKLAAMKFSQSGHTLYLTVMTAEQILSSCFTTEWDPAVGWDDLINQGYQRQPVAKHSNAIGDFLARDPTPFMPTSALLSARKSEYGSLGFVRLPSTPSTLVEFGEVEIPAGRQFFIVDYQHRWRGIRHAIEELGATHLSEFTIPAIIVEDMDRVEEILQFYLINSKQKRIDTDLALALLQTLAPQTDEREMFNLVGPGNRFRIRATRLTFALAARKSGVWVARIGQPHDLPQPEAVISLKSFVDSLSPLMSRWNPCSKLDDNALIDALLDFWEGVRRVIPNAFQNPRNYQIQRTVGTFALHIVFARAVYPRCVGTGDTSAAAVESILKSAHQKCLNESFWSTGGEATIYVGSSGYREVAKKIIQATLDAIPTAT